MAELDETWWRKSSRSAGETDCIEVAAAWRKSSRSAGESECVEAASLIDAVGVRDSKDPAGPVLQFPASTWRAFVAELKSTPHL